MNYDRRREEPKSLKSQLVNTFLTISIAFFLLQYLNLFYIISKPLRTLRNLIIYKYENVDLNLVEIEFQLMMFILLLLFILSRFYPIWKLGTEYRLRLFPPSWETSVGVEINQTIEMKVDLRLLNYLVNNSGDTLRYKIQLNAYDTRFIIILSSKRFLIPVASWKLKNKLIGLLDMYQISCLDFELKPDPTFIYRNVKIKKSAPDLNELITSLLSLASNDIIIETSTRFGRRKEITREKYYNIIPTRLLPTDDFMSDNRKNERVKPEFYYLSMKIGLKWNKLHYFDQITSIIEASALALKTTRLPLVYQKKIIALEALRFLEIPKIPQIEREKSILTKSPPLNYKPQKIIGEIMIEGMKRFQFGISKSDFKKGGIISGGIGNGKTTIRLHILHHLLQSKTQVIDFDIKGDAPRYKELAKYGRVIIPKKNFQINPFSKPKHYTRDEFVGVLTQMLLESLPDSESITPPQRHILTEAVKVTVETEGNARDFFRNIVMIGFASKGIVENYRDTSAQALLNKVSWMQSLLGDIFWTDTSTLSDLDISTSSLFFDLSVMKRSTPISLIRFFINIIMSHVISTIDNTKAVTSTIFSEEKPKLVVFIDEAQLLMPFNDGRELTKLEEIVTTLRYKGISVLAAGVSADLMSNVLIDTGFIAQYRSESYRLANALGLDRDEAQVINSLEPYTAIIQTSSIGPKGAQVYINDFEYKQDSEKEYYDSQLYINIESPRLESFEMTKSLVNEMKILTHFRSIKKVKLKYYQMTRKMLFDKLKSHFASFRSIYNKTSYEEFFVIISSYLCSLQLFQKKEVSNSLNQNNGELNKREIIFYSKIAIQLILEQFLEGNSKWSRYLDNNLYSIIRSFDLNKLKSDKVIQIIEFLDFNDDTMKVMNFLANINSVQEIILKPREFGDFIIRKKRTENIVFVHTIHVDFEQNVFVKVTKPVLFTKEEKHIIILKNMNNGKKSTYEIHGPELLQFVTIEGDSVVLKVESIRESQEMKL